MYEVSIIIINYNTFELTCKCIQSVYDKTTGLNFEIILVDNASVECDAVLFKSQFPEIVLIKNNINAGFAAGNNLGIQQAKGKYILLLNSDTELIENSIKIIYEKCLPIKDLGAATARLVYADGKVQSAANYLPSNWFFFLEISRLFRVFKKYYVSKRPALDYNKNFTAGWIWGTFFFFPKKNLDATNGKLSETFFMYGEDVEWGYLFTQRGLKSYYFADTTVIHHIGKSSYKEKNKTIVKNSRRFIKKYYGTLNCVAFIVLSNVNDFIETTKKKFNISKS